MAGRVSQKGVVLTRPSFRRIVEVSGQTRALFQDRDNTLMVWFWAYPMTRNFQGHAGFERLTDQVGLVRY